MRGWLKEAGAVELISEGGGPGSFVAAEALSVDGSGESRVVSLSRLTDAESCT
jgi:hypothetical protein